MYEGVEPDTDFTGSSWAALSIPGYASITFRQACIGKPVHGLHFGNFVLNTLDFAGPATIELTERFSTLTISSFDPTDVAWDGVKLVQQKERIKVSSIATGYLCGSATIIQVPGTLPRVPTSQDKAAFICWKDYALRSTQRGFVLGMELGKGGFIFTTGVGKTFWITQVGTTGSPTLNRKIHFNVVRFGVFGLPSEEYQIDYDTGVKDYTANSLITAEIVGLNYSVPFGLRLCDVAKNGVKCVLGMHIISPLSGDDDGVNQVGSWCVSFAECSFSLSGFGTVTVTGRIVQTYKGTNVREGNSFVSGNQAITMPGQLRKDSLMDGLPDLMYVGAYGEDSSGPYEKTEFGDDIIPGVMRVGLGFISQPDYVSTGDQNIAVGLIEFPQKIGHSRRIGPSADDIQFMRTIHMCYDSSDVLVPITVSYTQISDGLIETTLSANTFGSGRYTYTRGSSRLKEGTGNGGFTVVTGREQYSRKCIELRVKGILVDFFQVEHALPLQKTTHTGSYGFSGEEGSVLLGLIGDPTSVTDPSPDPLTVNTYSPALPGIAGPINYAGGYLPVKQAGGSAGIIRNTSVADVDAPFAKLRFFVRLESNKLVSATFANSGYSAGVIELPASETYSYFVETLAIGNNLRKTTWNCYTGAKAVNNVPGHGKADNPIFNEPAGNYHSAYHPVTGQCVINGVRPYAFI